MRKLDQHVAHRAFTLIEEVIAKDPYSGKKLKGKYSGLFSYRFSDYRIIYTMMPEFLVILTTFRRIIGHRNLPFQLRSEIAICI
ncbi:MAG: type II toxin-antitoxin system YoeB family toxin [Proteobacteria bacterium]|nr:type II toxin-antitoxin system YoeB family toxin [Pseudomonadota bacterium]